jgi:hypothetical protein
MNEAKEIIKSDESLKQKIKELIKQVMDEITTSAAAGSGEGSAGVPRVPTWVSKNKKGRPDVATALGYTLAKPVNEAAEPGAVPQQDPNAQQTQQGQEDPNLYDAKSDLSDFETRVSQSTLQNKGTFQNKIMSKIGNKQVQLRASKGYGQPEKDYIVNVSGVSIDFYYEKYVIVVKGREQGKQKESEYFVKAPYQIKILGNAVVTPSAKKKQQQAPATPVAPVVPTNTATKGV